jgi:NADH dehydrogenase
VTSRRAEPRVVIIGAGFGGLYAARALRDAPVHVTVLDRTNHHVFQPLLYQVATATLAPSDIAVPIRWLLRKQKNTEVLMAEVDSIDPKTRVVRCRDGTEAHYDFLILAAGARHSYFGHADWESFAPGLKSLEDAIELRRRWLLAFERAERTTNDADRTAELTFVIVGGGPTGVELAGMLPTIARFGLPKDFRHIDTTKARIVLIEAGPRLLPAMPEALSERAARDLVELGVELRIGERVTNVGDGFVQLDGERIEARTIFWAAGNAVGGLASVFDAPRDRSGRVRVLDDLSVPGYPEAFIVGDQAVLRSRGAEVPAVAPAAMQSGRAAARNIVHTVRGEGRERFRYRNKGDLATIGRYKAVGVVAGRQLTGWLAWWTWLFVHIMYLAGFRNRLSVLLEWGYSFFTYDRGARLITVPPPPAAPASSHTIKPTW